MKYSSFCSCGNVQVNLSLPKPLETYVPRACDCDFCTERNASYLSDPDGVLQITYTGELEQLKQGSEQATFWQCKTCHDLIGVTCPFKKGILGAVNVKLFDGKYNLSHSQPVSPKLLSAEEKLARWEEVWMRVELDT